MHALTLLAALIVSEPSPGANAQEARRWVAVLDHARSKTAEYVEERLVGSVVLCKARDDIAQARLDIAGEQERARRTGVSDLTLVAERREDLAKAEEARLTAVELLRALRLQPLDCGDAEVAHLVRCAHRMSSVSPSDWCADPGWESLREALARD